MIGIVLVRSRCLITSAASKPSMPGIWTSSRITAKSSRCSRMRSASAPDVGGDELVAERLEDRLEREQVLRAVVDEQERRRSQAAAPSQVRRARRAAARSRRPARRAPSGTARERGARHLVALGRRPGPARSRRRRARRSRARPRAPSAFAPVSTTPTHRSRYDSAAVSKQHVDRRARVLHRLVGRERERAVLDEQVVVGRRDVDGAAAASSSLSSASRTLQARDRAEQVAERGRMRLGRAVLRDHDGGVELGRQAAEDRRAARRARPTRRRSRRGRARRSSDPPVELLVGVELLVASPRTR